MADGTTPTPPWSEEAVWGGRHRSPLRSVAGRHAVEAGTSFHAWVIEQDGKSIAMEKMDRGNLVRGLARLRSDRRLSRSGSSSRHCRPPRTDSSTSCVGLQTRIVNNASRTAPSRCSPRSSADRCPYPRYAQFPENGQSSGAHASHRIACVAHESPAASRLDLEQKV